VAAKRRDLSDDGLWYSSPHGHRPCRARVGHLNGIPAWLTPKALPEIALKKKETIHSLLDRLEKFDTKAGHSFAWYFYMLHGNRIRSPVGEQLAEAIENGLYRLPAWDREVLQRWKEQPYAF
jgi:hypothetical protein